MLKPLGDRILVCPSEAEERSAGGIVLPDTARKKPQEGKVLAVGSGKPNKKGERVPPAVKVGDVIIYSKWAGTEIKIGGEELILIDEDSILAVKA
jgi:chaperonin GroES